MLIRPINQEWELWKWMAAVALAALLTLAITSAVAASDTAGGPRTQPQLLPNEITQWAVPMGNSEFAISGDRDDLPNAVWVILELHRVQKYEQALEAWQELETPTETTLWKCIALGQASIATGRLDEAEKVLGQAINMQPDNAIAYYFRGVLRMQQAYLAHEWPDNLTLPETRLVKFDPNQVVPNTKSMYELAATMDFEKAIELAKAVQLDESIVPSYLPTTAAIEPTVRDLLMALGADLFEAKAHNTLSYLFLTRGALEQAELHMDQAVIGGLSAVYGYQDLGNEYRARGQYADATRAYLKATKFSSNKLETLLDAMDSLRQVFTR